MWKGYGELGEKGKLNSILGFQHIFNFWLLKSFFELTKSLFL